MDYIYVGDIVNTHGLKGELRILSDFQYKDTIFVPGFKLYVGRQKEELIINTYRKHKNYDMVTFIDVQGIEEAIAYKGDKVYVNRKDVKVDGYFDEDYIGLKVYVLKEYKGTVVDILKNKANDILIIANDDKRYLIPNIKEFIEKVDLDNSKLQIYDIKGLFDEN